MEEKFGKKPHSLRLENRSSLTLSGVTDMGAFDEENVTAYTDYGCLSVSGSNLHVEELNVAKGILELSGEITAMVYSSKTSKEKNIFKRLFGA
ncbi:MAG TPA: sporulation protein YabP [Candidatus Eubacterium faecipullorum]|uniref:Sporulation protein YabP n=1 Tax=Candidatus Eubacterium faecipullorum TaxID=2838571 RepID=A0A9D1UFS9_9FIRM|nr:sporulation protein YabP [Candidatus Eubacterium faecipullorum]